MTLLELALAFLNAQSRLANDVAELGDKIGEDLVEHARAKLGTYQGESGFFPAWEPLSQFTIEDKHARGYPVPSPLYREGDMSESIHSTREIKSQSLVVTLEAGETALLHVLGTVNEPPRPFVAPTVFERGAIYSDWLGDTAVVSIAPGI